MQYQPRCIHLSCLDCSVARLVHVLLLEVII